MEMQQVAWAAVGLLAVAVFGLFGMFFYLGSKIDALGARLDGRIDSMAGRLDALAGQLQAHIERHAS
jgi:hypothetical protein